MEQLFQAEQGRWIDAGALLRIVGLYHDDARVALTSYLSERPTAEISPRGP